MNVILDDQMVDSVELKCLVVSRGLKVDRKLTTLQLPPDFSSSDRSMVFPPVIDRIRRLQFNSLLKATKEPFTRKGGLLFF